MKGFIKRGSTVLCLSAGLTVSNGCATYQNLVDPCYPQRYEYLARQETNASMAPQVNNGRVLDQTVWNHHFEIGTDRLNAAGMDHLSYLARRRPAPDPTIYLQTAQDIPCDTFAPDKFAAQRALLDEHRVKTIQNYLTAITAGRNLKFDVVIHDPSDPSLPALPLGGDGGRTIGAIQKMYTGFQGNLPSSGGSSAGSATGGASGGGGGGR